jgi:hypothetical protein
LQDVIRQALTSYKAGRLAEASTLARQAWEGTSSTQAAGLLSLIALDQNDVHGAIAWLQSALSIEPRNAAIRHQLGMLLLQDGRPEAAESELEAAVRDDTDRGVSWLALGRCRLALRKTNAALAALKRASAFPDQHDDAIQLFVDSVPLDRQGREAEPSRPGTGEPISIVMCSIDEAKVARARASFEHALQGWPHEFVIVRNPRSLAEGYSAGLARAKGPLVVFSHDDVEVLSHDLGRRLAGHLAECDIVGVAGATEASGPAWSHAGHPFLHGSVIYPYDSGFEVTVYSVQGPLVSGAKVLDGVFIATRKSVAERIGWDADTFRGFHGYDVDFTLRAAAAGLRLAVATDLRLVHHSKGRFGSDWQADAQALRSKFPQLRGTPNPQSHFFARHLASREDVAAFCAGLERLWTAA